MINNFINNVNVEPSCELVKRDINRFTFVLPETEILTLKKEIEDEFESLPIVSRLMIYRTKLHYQKHNYLKNTNETKV